MDEAATVIADLKNALGVTTDSDLARKLRVDKSTIASWKARGSVPDRYKGIAAGDPMQAMLAPPLKWSEHEQAAFSLALFRFCRTFAGEIAAADFHTMLRVFGTTSWQLWVLFAEAQTDLAEEIGRSACSVQMALAMRIHRDLEQGATMVDQHRDLLKQTLSPMRVDGVEKPWP